MMTSRICTHSKNSFDNIFKDVWGRLINKIFLGSCFLLKQLKSFCVGVLRIMALLFGESNCTVESYFFFDGKTFFCFVLNWKVSYLKGHPVFNSAVSIGSKNLTIRGVPVMNKGAFNNFDYLTTPLEWTIVDILHNKHPLLKWPSVDFLLTP